MDHIDIKPVDLNKKQWAVIAKALDLSIPRCKEYIKYNLISFGQYTDMFKPKNVTLSKQSVMYKSQSKTGNKLTVEFPFLRREIESEVFILIDDNLIEHLEKRLKTLAKK